MKSTFLQDSFHILIACGAVFFAIQHVNAQGVERFTPLLLLGYAVAIAAFVLSGRAFYRSTYGCYPTLRDLKKPALYIAVGFAGGAVMNFLSGIVQSIFGYLFFGSLATAANIAFRKSLPRPEMPGDMVEGQGPSDSPRRRPPPM